MYYEEKLIDGEWCFRTGPDYGWHEREDADAWLEAFYGQHKENGE